MTDTTRSAEAIFDRILSGDLARRAQGFLIVLPQGYRMQSFTEARLSASYGAIAHPDIRRLVPEGAGNLITVDRMRDTLPFLAASPASEPMKTLVIFDAHRMNESAANALLKPLEEPTASTRILILTDKPGALPVTIRSRCSVFTPAPDKEIAMAEILADLGEDAPKTKGTIVDALSLADGDPTLAAQMIRFKLVAWGKKVDTWLDNQEPSPPLPVLAGKNAAPLSAIALCLQALLVRRGRALVEAGTPAGPAIEASWSVVAGIDDIGRAGIDARTRLHTLMMRARRALS